MTGYGTDEIAKMLDLSAREVRRCAALLELDRGSRGEYRFTFQDLVLLRAAKGLVKARISPARLKRTLKKLRAQLPAGRPLTAVRIVANGKDIVVQDGGTAWNPESGQVLLDFPVAELVPKAVPAARRAAAEARRDESQLTANDWYDLGCELEATVIDDARDAYRRAIELDPRHADAHVNLGRIQQDAGDPAAAVRHYQVALDFEPEHAVAAFNLGVALEDLGRPADAASAYEIALESDPDLADAHYNLAELHERLGRKALAIQHLAAYRRLTAGPKAR